MSFLIIFGVVFGIPFVDKAPIGSYCPQILVYAGILCVVCRGMLVYCVCMSVDLNDEDSLKS